MPLLVKSLKKKAETPVPDSVPVQDVIEMQMVDVTEAVRDVSESHNKNLKTSSFNPKVGLPFPAYDPWPDTQKLIYGFANGMVDVFPYESLPNRCRGNIT